MSGETEQDVSGWTTDTLHTHFIRQLDLLREAITEQRRSDERARDIAFRAQETAMQAALSSQEKAVTAAMAAAERASEKTDAASEKRFDSVNEFRGQQADILRVTMPRAEAEVMIQRATERLTELAAAQAQTVSRAEMEAQHLRDTERITELATRLNTVETMARAAAGSRAALYSFLGVGFTLILVTIAVLNFVTSR